METLETVRLDKMAELARYRQRPDAKPYVVKKLIEQGEALNHCVDLNDSRVDNELLILLRDTICKALHVEDRDDVLIVGMRLTDRPEIERIAIADLVYSARLDDPQKGLYELLEIGKWTSKLYLHKKLSTNFVKFPELVYSHIFQGRVTSDFIVPYFDIFEQFEFQLHRS